MSTASRGEGIRSHAGRAVRATSKHLERTLGGPERTRVILILACVLALSSADSATVGAAAAPLRSALHISNTDIGLLVTVSSLVAAAASLPFGVVADRWPRIRILGAAIVAWGGAMLWSATASNFQELLLARLVLGGVTAAAGPLLASLVGDYFEGSERGRIYSYILTGELAGAGIGFAVTGDIAALSWRAAFVILALPAFVLAWKVFSLPEPVRGGSTPLRPVTSDGEPSPRESGPSESGPSESGPSPEPSAPIKTPHLEPDDTPTDAQRLAAARGIGPDEALVIGPRLASLNLFQATKAVLRIRTNVILIVASACGYFYLSGVETFGTEFVRQQYRIDQVLANFLLLVVGLGAVLGTLVAGGLSDRLLRSGYLNARILVAALAAIGATALFIPSLVAHSAVTAVPYLTLAALFLAAQNPPIDAARLDIVPALLWGRAEAVRTVLRSLAQSLAPVLFGVTSDHVFGGGRSGLQWTFSVMLISMGASGVVLLRALRTYPRDVATAAASLTVARRAGDVPGSKPRRRTRPAGRRTTDPSDVEPSPESWAGTHPTVGERQPVWPDPPPPAPPDKR
jgi:MFS family permease